MILIQNRKGVSNLKQKQYETVAQQSRANKVSIEYNYFSYREDATAAAAARSSCKDSL